MITKIISTDLMLTNYNINVIYTESKFKYKFLFHLNFDG